MGASEWTMKLKGEAKIYRKNDRERTCRAHEGKGEKKANLRRGEWRDSKCIWCRCACDPSWRSAAGATPYLQQMNDENHNDSYKQGNSLTLKKGRTAQYINNHSFISDRLHSFFFCFASPRRHLKLSIVSLFISISLPSPDLWSDTHKNKNAFPTNKKSYTRTVPGSEESQSTAVVLVVIQATWMSHFPLTWVQRCVFAAWRWTSPVGACCHRAPAVRWPPVDSSATRRR